MRVAAAIALMAAVLAGQDSAPASRFYGRLLSRAEMLFDLDVLEAAIREKWAYLEDKEKNAGVDVKALVAHAKARLPDAASPGVFHGAVARIVSGLKDGHGEAWYPVPTAHRLPFTVADVPEGLVVVRAPNTELYHAQGLQPGDRLVSMDGVPIETRLSNLERWNPASTDGARRNLCVSGLHAVLSLKTDVVVLRDGKQVELDVWSLDPRFGLDHPELDLDAPGPNWHIDRPAPKIARLRVRSFAVDDWSRWLAASVEQRDALLAETRARIDAAFHEIAGVDALILDLRGNYGGTDLLGTHLAKHLLAKRFVYFQLSAKVDGAWTKPYGYEHDPLPVGERFDGPLVILIDEWCFSTTDNFLRAIVEQRPGVVAVVGRPTHGGTGCPATIATLPNSGEQVTLCTQRVYGPKGGLIEGRGTKPTLPVRWTAADYLEGRDPYLAAALEALHGAASRPK
jgi:C-terminal processing protease CtpA/Prc